MGLTIHYSLATEADDQTSPLSLVEELRGGALRLPFESVGEIIDFDRPRIMRERNDGNAETRWLLIQAGHFLQRDGQYFDVTPTRVIAFSTNPGPGCEGANFGLCKFPETIEADGMTLPTGLRGWRWSSFCKTQYASHAECGGVENFLRCHIGLVQLLDHARELGMLENVTDESHYWESRDAETLARTVGDWNEMVAGFVGRMKDAADGDGEVESPMTDFPDFEHLEARGRDERE